MKTNGKRKTSGRYPWGKNSNISVIIEEAALNNITVIVNNEKGRYAINLGDYLGAAIEHSIKVIEEAKKDEGSDEKAETAEENEEGGETEPSKEIHLA